MLRTSPTTREARSEVEADVDPFKDIPILNRTAAELYLFDTDTDVFVLQEKTVSVDLASNGEYDGMFTRMP